MVQLHLKDPRTHSLRGEARAPSRWPHGWATGSVGAPPLDHPNSIQLLRGPASPARPARHGGESTSSRPAGRGGGALELRDSLHMRADLRLPSGDSPAAHPVPPRHGRLPSGSSTPRHRGTPDADALADSASGAGGRGASSRAGTGRTAGPLAGPSYRARWQCPRVLGATPPATRSVSSPTCAGSSARSQPRYRRRAVRAWALARRPPDSP